MSFDSDNLGLFGNCLFAIPTLLVYIAGIVLSVMFWRKHPQISMFALIAFSMLALNSVFSGLYQIFIINRYVRGDLDSRTLGLLSTVWGVISILLNAAAWVLVMLAIFKGRSGQGTPRRDS